MAIIDNIISVYHFDESSGDATDEVGGHTLTNISAMPYSAGLFNNAADATEVDYLVSTTHTGFSGIGTGDFTVSFWVNLTNSADDPVAIGQLSAWAAPTGWACLFDNTGEINFVMGNASVAITNTADLLNTGWNNIIITRTGNVGTIYVNNVQEGTNTNAGTNCVDQDFIIGGAILGGRTSDCSFDELILWDRVITSDERATIYEDGVGTTYPSFRNLVGETGTVSEGPGTIGTRIIAKRYPVEEGLIAGTTKQTGVPYLVDDHGR